MLSVNQTVIGMALVSARGLSSFSQKLFLVSHQIQKSQQRNNKPNQGTQTKGLYDSLKSNKVLRYKIQQRNNKPSKTMWNTLLTS